MSNISTLEVGKLVEGIVGAIGNIFSGGSSKSDAGTDKIMLNPRF